MRRSWLTAAVLLAFGGQAAEASCAPLDGGMAMHSADRGRFAAALNFNPAPVRVGAPFSVAVRLCSAEGARAGRLAIDARMPAHRHGMNYQPVITPQGEGAYEARGFLFHMPGKWEIMLSVTDAATSKPQHFTLELDIR